ncbi:uncharacterized protein LOC126770243 isoform X2 [Nymphalis io]|uniref:uncharacterized protein LOC126770243 isoform X2 n=1 Tax=Inachis io TaxID=171585 RepID=UPI0021676D71|nr:uncharacterized protein LOC126770243 isoform X2 [Nymphalis io]
MLISLVVSVFDRGRQECGAERAAAHVQVSRRFHSAAVGDPAPAAVVAIPADQCYWGFLSRISQQHREIERQRGVVGVVTIPDYVKFSGHPLHSIVRKLMRIPDGNCENRQSFVDEYRAAQEYFISSLAQGCHLEIFSKLTESTLFFKRGVSLF